MIRLCSFNRTIVSTIVRTLKLNFSCSLKRQLAVNTITEEFLIFIQLSRLKISANIELQTAISQRFFTIEGE